MSAGGVCISFVDMVGMTPAPSCCIVGCGLWGVGCGVWFTNNALCFAENMLNGLFYFLQFERKKKKTDQKRKKDAIKSVDRP